jgi:histidine ammonia-lyase
MTAHVAAAALQRRFAAHPATLITSQPRAEKRPRFHGNDERVEIPSIVDLAENLLAINCSLPPKFGTSSPVESGAGVERAFATVRKFARPLTQDRPLANDIARVAEAVRRGDFDSAGEAL